MAVLTLLGGLLRFTRLGAQSFWEDEVVTVGLIREPLWAMLRHGIPYSENTPPLYYVIGWVWVRLFGTSELGVRSLSALVGTATVPVAYLVGRSLVTVRAALVAALVVALSPLLVWYSQEARPYSLFVFLSALSFLFFARTLSTYGRGDLAGWVATSALALTTHYFAVFLVVIEALWLLYRVRRTRALVLAFVPLVAVGLGLLPLILKQRSVDLTAFIGNTRLTIRLGQLGAWFATGDLRATAALVVTGLLVSFGVWLLLFASERFARLGGLTALGVGLGAIAIPLLLIPVGFDYFFFRNLILAWVPLAVALTAGFTAQRAGLGGLAAAAALCVVFLIVDIAVFAQPDLQRDNWRSAAAVVTAARGPTGIVVYPAWDSQPLAYYAPKLSLAKRSIRVRSLWFVGVSSQFSGWKSPAGLTLQIPSGFRQVSSERFQHFVLRRYAAPEQTTITPSQFDRFVEGANGKNVPHSQALVLH